MLPNGGSIEPSFHTNEAGHARTMRESQNIHFHFLVLFKIIQIHCLYLLRFNEAIKVNNKTASFCKMLSKEIDENVILFI